MFLTKVKMSEERSLCGFVRRTIPSVTKVKVNKDKSLCGFLIKTFFSM